MVERRTQEDQPQQDAEVGPDALAIVPAGAAVALGDDLATRGSSRCLLSRVRPRGDRPPHLSDRDVDFDRAPQ